MSSKKILDSRKLLGAMPRTDLKELGLLYKGLMKKHHPDRFQDEGERVKAEEVSKHLIDAYHFLVSIHPETHATNKEEFERTATTSVISDWRYKAMTLHLIFGDGSEYEYFGVPQNVYNKFVNNNGNLRFARRHILSVFTYRRLKKVGPTEAES
ncbi:MAG: KTSC domain-containing protein [Flavobacteriales bacterium]|jgi:DnaJ-class molecular chaperone|nr:KTSC domain-containing protein [Flavobacteriales bacterium]MBK6549046.1 KTSC domain-containing protein [Flavobacteriales bacterium]MBK6884360.1 KTSC domain-containing protein [Flavobacteriales bacterium]MBK7100756.1 KTSC domain-containing protein [Flavobacteriales bacterium]MBK7111444.1 KTSC domain-containing protein [Flavobacteriales bacterium]